MVNAILITWDATPTDFGTITNLNSLADGNIWQSGEINDASPSDQILRISYELVFNATPVAGDYLAFWIASGDEASSNEIWDGGIGTSESEISVAASVAEALASLGQPAKTHAWQTNHGTTFQGHFDVFNFGPSWQLLIQASGEALSATGNRVRYRYGTPEVQ